MTGKSDITVFFIGQSLFVLISTEKHEKICNIKRTDVSEMNLRRPSEY